MDEGRWLALFLLEDALRPDAEVFLRRLRERGLAIHLISGDDTAVVAAVAKQLGITGWAGGVSPQGKFSYVEQLQAQGRVVVMFGDGLNDAPVLARADASIAMGSGAEAALAQADLVVLGGGSLASAAGSFGTARRAMALIRENLAWALVYNAIALPLAVAGAIGPWEAAVGMAASSFIVVLNGGRRLSGRIRGA